MWFKISKLLINAYIFSFFLVTRAFATAYYVAPSGNDTNSGSQSAPYKNISKGVAALVPGDTLFVRSGNYSSFTVTKSGTIASPIIITNYPGETPIISGGQGIRLQSVSYITIRGFEVMGSTGSWSGGIYVSSGNNNLIEKNYVHDVLSGNNSGILISNGSNNRIISNKIYNTAYEGIRIISTSPQSGNEIAYNESFHNVIGGSDGDGMGLNGSQLTNTYIHHNIVYDNADDGIDTWDSPSNQIISNRVYNNGSGTGDGNGIKSGGDTTGGNNFVVGNISFNNRVDGFASNGSGSKFYNNTSYGNGGDGFNDGWRNSGCKYCKSEFINNIAMNNSRYNAYFSSDTALSHHNLWYSNSGIKVNKGTNYSTLASLYSATGLDDPSKSKSLDPKFVNPQSAQFELQSSSVAINSGDPTNPGKIIANGVVDIGAIEFGSGSNSPPPLSIPGDFNNDTHVNLLDYNLIVSNFGNPYTLLDYNLIASNFGI